MCLTTKQRWPKIAWKPIKVYKVVCKSSVKDLYLTLFQCCPICLGVSYKESIFQMIKNRYKYDDNYEINIGLHAFVDLRRAKLLTKDNSEYNTLAIECEIPRFSFYWIGDDGDIVSNKLKYIKIL